MSVIFKTLKKLQQRTDFKGHGAKDARLKKTGFLDRFLNTPLFMGLLLGGVVLAGFLLLYGLGKISNGHREARGSRPEFRVVKNASKPVKSPDHKALQEEISSSSTPSAGAKVLPSLFETQGIDGDASPPLKSEPFHQRPSGGRPMGADLSEPASFNSTPSFSDPIKAMSAQSLSGSATTIPMEKTNVVVAKTNKAQNGNSFPSVFKPNDPPIPTQAASPFKANLSKDNPLLLSQDNRLLKIASVNPEQTSDPQQQRHLANLEKFRRTAKKRADIAKLVTQIEAAILSMDAPAVKKMMPRLSAAKGQDNLYVLNLKAFWYLKQKRYLAAETLLKKILKQNQDHLEAGVNMAVVEAKTQRKETALKRLRRLKALYPENQVLIEMIRKLS
jgi:hypothetical protein